MKWTIRRKILAGFTASILFTTGLIIFSMIGMNRLNRETSALGNTWLPITQQLNQAADSFNSSRIQQFNYFLESDEQLRAQIEAELNQQIERFMAEAKRCESLLTRPEDKKLYYEMMNGFNEYREQSTQFVSLIKAGQQGEASQLLLQKLKETLQK